MYKNDLEVKVEWYFGKLDNLPGVTRQINKSKRINFK